MISQEIQDMLTKDAHLFISADNVAIVQEENSLDHALLVLSKVQYSVIPVVDHHYHLVGLISIPMIIEKIMGLNTIHFNDLHQYKVKEVMSKNVPKVNKDTDLEDILNEMIDHNFLCIVNEEEEFLGIVTRKEVLKRVNYLVHELTKSYDISNKNSQ